MTLLEKMKSWWRPLVKQVKIYIHLHELIADLRAVGLPQRAKEVEETLCAGMCADEILGEESILLDRILKEETLPQSLKRKIRRIQFEAWGICHRIFAIEASEILHSVPTSPKPEPVALPVVNYERACKWIGKCYGNEDFCFVKCHTCGKFALMDNEIETIYRSSDNPCDARLYGVTESVICPNCGVSDSFVDTSEDDAEAIRKSEWAEFLRGGIRLPFLTDGKNLLIDDVVVATFPYPIKMARAFDQTVILILDIPDEVVFSDNVYGYVIPEKRLWQIEHNGYYPTEEQSDILIIDFIDRSDTTVPVLWSWTCFAVWINPDNGKVIKTEFFK